MMGLGPGIDSWSYCSAHHDFSNLRTLSSCIHDHSPPSQLPRTHIQKYRVRGVALPSLTRSHCFQQGPHTSQSFPDSRQQNCMKLPQLYLSGTLCSGELCSEIRCLPGSYGIRVWLAITDSNILRSHGMIGLKLSLGLDIRKGGTHSRDTQ